jgi:hypothetical protein
VHAPTEDKNYDTKNSFYDELRLLFNHFTKHHMKMFLGDLPAKAVTEYFYLGLRLYMKLVITIG